MRPIDPGDRPFWEDDAFLESANAIPPRPSPAPSPVHGAARFANAAELAPWLSPSGAPHDTAIAGFAPLVAGDGGSLKPWWRRTFHWPEELLSRHVLAVGQTGSGKTTGVLLPIVASQVLDRERTLVVFDAKNELRGPIDELARRAGRDPDDVLHVDLTDPARTVGWNPAGDSLDPDGAFELALHMCRAAETRGGSESPFWLQTSTDVIAGILVALVEDPREEPGLARVREILNLPRDHFLKWFRAHAKVPQLERFAAFLATDSHNAHTCLTDASNRLLVFLDRALCAVTSHDELRLDRLVDRPTVLVVSTPETHLERLRPLFNLLVQQIVAVLIRRAEQSPGARLPRPVSLILDEFASALGRLPDFEVRLNTLRSRRVAVIAAAQNLGQIRQLYRDGAESLLAGFSSKVFLAGLEAADARYASELAGTMTAMSPAEHEGWNEARASWQRASRTLTPVPRPLLLPEEIQRPPEHFELGRPATWFVTTLPPFQAWTVPAHRRDDLREILVAARRGAFADRGRRRTALRWTPGRRGGDPAAGSHRRLDALEVQLGLPNAGRRARQRWREIRRRHDDEPQLLVEALRRLRDLGSELEEFVQASERCGSSWPPAVVDWLAFEKSAAAGRRAQTRTGELPFPDLDGTTDIADLDDVPF